VKESEDRISLLLTTVFALEQQNQLNSVDIKEIFKKTEEDMEEPNLNNDSADKKTCSAC